MTIEDQCNDVVRTLAANPAANVVSAELTVFVLGELVKQRKLHPDRAQSILDLTASMICPHAKYMVSNPDLLTFIRTNADKRDTKFKNFVKALLNEICESYGKRLLIPASYFVNDSQSDKDLFDEKLIFISNIGTKVQVTNAKYERTLEFQLQRMTKHPFTRLWLENLLNRDGFVAEHEMMLADRYLSNGGELNPELALNLVQRMCKQPLATHENVCILHLPHLLRWLKEHVETEMFEKFELILTFNAHDFVCIDKNGKCTTTLSSTEDKKSGLLKAVTEYEPQH